MSVARVQALKGIKAGDVIFGIAGGGQEKLLFVYEADENKIIARHVTSQMQVEFGRDGRSIWCQGGGTCAIVSTAALPAKHHAVAVGLDRKMKGAKKLTDLRLSESEIRLLLTHSEFFRARPLPE